MNPTTASSAETPVEPSPAPLRAGRLWAAALAGAIAAGVVPFLVGEALPRAFAPAMETVPQNGQKFTRPVAGGVEAAERKNAMLGFGVVGASLGLALGAAGGLARGSRRSSGVGVASGLVLGAGFGAAAAGMFVSILHRRLAGATEDLNGDILLPTALQAGIWSSLGAAGGAALGLGAGAGRRLMAVALGGWAGGAAGAVAYVVLTSLLFPAGRTFRPIADTWPPRLLAATVIPAAIALVATAALVAPARRPSARIDPLEDGHPEHRR